MGREGVNKSYLALNDVNEIEELIRSQRSKFSRKVSF
jgi:hypothetical protein